MIENLKKSDIDECVEIAKIIFNIDNYSFDIKKELLLAFDDNQFTKPEYFIYREDNIIKGFAGLANTGFDNQIYGFFSCYVLPQYQFKGIGKKLVEARIQRLIELKAEMILVTTQKIWHLERFGFEIIETKTKYKWTTMFKQLDK